LPDALAKEVGRSMSTIQEGPGRTLGVRCATQRAGFHILRNKFIRGAKHCQPLPNSVF